ncbi:MAG: hypothetical protein ABI960_03570 [Candidatus Eisenbacteria bacterium]
MKLDSARELKRSLLAAPGFRRSTPPRAGPSPLVFASFPEGGAARGQPLPVALGIAGKGKDCRLAVRVHDPFPGIGDWLARVREIARGEVDVRVIGRIVRLARAPRSAQAVPWPVRRHRPLTPGISVGHLRVTAGTLGAIVEAARAGAGPRYLLSNNHVLAEEDRARKGDLVLQPGRADGGRAPGDAIARFERAVRLKRAGNRVDAALARLEDGVAFEPSKLRGLGRLQGVRAGPLVPGERVAKLGRTTGLTRGIVSAIEVDGVIVGYDEGERRFDDQVEISPAGRVPFSRGGDSGSLIVDADRLGVALLFAGNDADTTYASPLPAVLAALRVRLVTGVPATPAHAGRSRAHAAARRAARAAFSAHGTVAGVGMTRVDGQPAIKVNFTAPPRARVRMPKHIQGLPVVVAVVGEIKKQDA